MVSAAGSIAMKGSKVVAPRGVRKAWWIWKVFGGLVVAIAILVVSFGKGGEDRAFGVGLFVVALVLSCAIMFLWRRDKL